MLERPHGAGAGVVGADGALIGYAGGLARKRHLLDLESGQQVLKEAS